MRGEHLAGVVQLAGQCLFARLAVAACRDGRGGAYGAVAGQRLLADEVLHEVEGAAGGGAVGVDDPLRAARALQYLVVTDEADPDTDPGASDVLKAPV
nr:hypothetical protein [Streptomyces acidiscabies]